MYIRRLGHRAEDPGPAVWEKHSSPWLTAGTQTAHSGTTERHFSARTQF